MKKKLKIEPSDQPFNFDSKDVLLWLMNEDGSLACSGSVATVSTANHQWFIDFLKTLEVPIEIVPEHQLIKREKKQEPHEKSPYDQDNMEEYGNIYSDDYH